MSAARMGKALIRCRIILELVLSSHVLPVFADEPLPECREAAKYMVPITKETPESEIGPSNYRNAKYFFDHVISDDDGSPASATYMLDSRRIRYPSVSVFFPNTECPSGCWGHLVRLDERGPFIERFFFISHFVSQPAPPRPALVLLAPDMEHLLMISVADRDIGGPIADIRDVLAGTRDLHEWSTAYRSCLLKGKFDFFETSPAPAPQK